MLTFLEIHSTICATEMVKIQEKACAWKRMRMYKFDDGQISIHEFGQPIGMKLREGNRWDFTEPLVGTYLL
jgi:hypothetical protein